MEATMRIHACPTCGRELCAEGAGYRCAEHGMWLSYGSKLLVLAPTGEHKVRDRFTMPWEARWQEAQSERQ